MNFFSSINRFFLISLALSEISSETTSGSFQSSFDWQNLNASRPIRFYQRTEEPLKYPDAMEKINIDISSKNSRDPVTEKIRIKSSSEQLGSSKLLIQRTREFLSTESLSSPNSQNPFTEERESNFFPGKLIRLKKDDEKTTKSKENRESSGAVTDATPFPDEKISQEPEKLSLETTNGVPQFQEEKSRQETTKRASSTLTAPLRVGDASTSRTTVLPIEGFSSTTGIANVLTAFSGFDGRRMERNGGTTTVNSISLKKIEKDENSSARTSDNKPSELQEKMNNTSPSLLETEKKVIFRKMNDPRLGSLTKMSKKSEKGEKKINSHFETSAAAEMKHPVFTVLEIVNNNRTTEEKKHPNDIVKSNGTNRNFHNFHRNPEKDLNISKMLPGKIMEDTKITRRNVNNFLTTLLNDSGDGQKIIKHPSDYGKTWSISVFSSYQRPVHNEKKAIGSNLFNFINSIKTLMKKTKQHTAVSESARNAVKGSSQVPVPIDHKNTGQTIRKESISTGSLPETRILKVKNNSKESSSSSLHKILSSLLKNDADPSEITNDSPKPQEKFSLLAFPIIGDHHIIPQARSVVKGKNLNSLPVNKDYRQSMKQNTVNPGMIEMKSNEILAKFPFVTNQYPQTETVTISISKSNDCPASGDDTQRYQICHLADISERVKCHPRSICTRILNEGRRLKLICENSSIRVDSSKASQVLESLPLGEDCVEFIYEDGNENQVLLMCPDPPLAWKELLEVGYESGGKWSKLRGDVRSLANPWKFSSLVKEVGPSYRVTRQPEVPGEVFAAIRWLIRNDETSKKATVNVTKVPPASRSFDFGERNIFDTIANGSAMALNGMKYVNGDAIVQKEANVGSDKYSSGIKETRVEDEHSDLNKKLERNINEELKENYNKQPNKQSDEQFLKDLRRHLVGRKNQEFNERSHEKVNEQMDRNITKQTKEKIIDKKIIQQLIKNFVTGIKKFNLIEQNPTVDDNENLKSPIEATFLRSPTTKKIARENVPPAPAILNKVVPVEPQPVAGTFVRRNSPKAAATTSNTKDGISMNRGAFDTPMSPLTKNAQWMKSFKNFNESLRNILLILSIKDEKGSTKETMDPAPNIRNKANENGTENNKLNFLNNSNSSPWNSNSTNGRRSGNGSEIATRPPMESKIQYPQGTTANNIIPYGDGYVNSKINHRANVGSDHNVNLNQSASRVITAAPKAQKSILDDEDDSATRGQGPMKSTSKAYGARNDDPYISINELQSDLQSDLNRKYVKNRNLTTESSTTKNLNIISNSYLKNATKSFTEEKNRLNGLLSPNASEINRGQKLPEASALVVNSMKNARPEIKVQPIEHTVQIGPNGTNFRSNIKEPIRKFRNIEYSTPGDVAHLAARIVKMRLNKTNINTIHPDNGRSGIRNFPNLKKQTKIPQDLLSQIMNLILNINNEENLKNMSQDEKKTIIFQILTNLKNITTSIPEGSINRKFNDNRGKNVGAARDERTIKTSARINLQDRIGTKAPDKVISEIINSISVNQRKNLEEKPEIRASRILNLKNGIGIFESLLSRMIDGNSNNNKESEPTSIISQVLENLRDRAEIPKNIISKIIALNTTNNEKNIDSGKKSNEIRAMGQPKVNQSNSKIENNETFNLNNGKKETPDSKPDFGSLLSLSTMMGGLKLFENVIAKPMTIGRIIGQKAPDRVRPVGRGIERRNVAAIISELTAPIGIDKELFPAGQISFKSLENKNVTNGENNIKPKNSTLTIEKMILSKILAVRNKSNENDSFKLPNSTIQEEFLAKILFNMYNNSRNNIKPQHMNSTNKNFIRSEILVTNNENDEYKDVEMKYNNFTNEELILSKILAEMNKLIGHENLSNKKFNSAFNSDKNKSSIPAADEDLRKELIGESANNDEIGWYELWFNSGDGKKNVWTEIWNSKKFRNFHRQQKFPKISRVS